MAGGVVILAAAGPSPLWYLSRGTGAITLVLLSASVILGITGTLRWRLGARTPRFVVDGLHRNVSLLVVVLLAAHIVTSLLDPFAHLRVLDAVVPLASRYRPLWLGFGALAFDLLIALIVTSVAARAAGPARLAGGALGRVRVLAGGRAARPGHGDRRALGRGCRLLTAACVAGVVAALAARLLRDWPARAGLRLGALALVAASVVGTVAFALQGPLQAGLGAPRRHAAARCSPRRRRRWSRARVSAPRDGRAALRRRARRHLQADRLRGRRARAGRHRGPDPRRRRAAAPRPAALWAGASRAAGCRWSPAASGSARADGRTSTAAGWSALRGDLVVARLTSPGARPVQLRLALRIDAGGAVVGTADAQEVP